MGNLFSVRPTRPRSFRAALLGAAAIAAVGGVTIEALPISTYPAVAAATIPSAGPASFADVVDRVKGAVVSVKVKVEESNVSFDTEAQPMPNFPKGGPLEKFFRQFEERGFRSSAAARTMSSPAWAWRRARASSFPPTATSSPTITSSSTPRT